MLKNKRIDPRDPETIEWGEQISETKTCAEFANLPGRYGIRTSQIFNDAEIDVFVGEYETSLGRITSGNPSETEFYASGGMAYIIVNAAHVGQDIRADYYPGGSVLTAEVLDSEDFKGPQGDTGPQGPTGPAGAPGDVSDVLNVGAGVGVFKEIATGTARFKSLVAGANINLDTTDPDEIEISVDAGSLVGDAINATSKGTIVDNDRIAGANSESSNSVVYWLFSTIKTAVFGAINGLTAKTTPVGADVIAIGDSAASFAGKKTTVAQLAASLKTYITAQATPTRVTSAAPDALGEYRSYLRASSARTYSETNGSPTTAPSSSNGYLLYSNAAWASGDSSGQPSRYEIFIGANKEPVFEFYRSAGRTGFIDVTPFYAFGGGNYDGGIFYGYDPATGIAYVTKAYPSGGTVSAGMDAAGSPIASTIYFDIKC